MSGVNKASLLNEENPKEKGLSLRKSILWNTVGSLFYVIANWVITVLVVLLTTSYSDAGSLAVAMAVGNVASSIVLFKARSVQVSDVDSQFSSEDYIGLNIICIALALIFCLGYSALTVSPVDYFPVLAYVLFKIVDSFVSVYHGIDQRHQRLDFAGISQLLRGVLIVACFVAGMILTESLTISILLMTASSSVVVFFYDKSRAARFESTRPRFVPLKIKSLFLICLPGFLASLFSILVVSLSRQWYGLEYGNELLGIYATVGTPAVIVQALASYIYAPLLGPIAQSWKSGEFAELTKLIIRFLFLIVLVLLAAIFIFAIAGEFLFGLVFGQELASYNYLMFPLLLSTGAAAAIAFAIDILIVFRDYFGAIISGIISLLACIVTMNIFIVSFGMDGISFTIVFSYMVGVLTSCCFIFSGLKRC